MRGGARVRRAPPLAITRAGSRRCVLGAVPVELDARSPHAARYVKEKFDLHLARLADPEHLARPRSFYTGNASLRTEVMREVGGFDESFGIYGNEDVELALRLRTAGVELGYDPEALAYQEYGKELAGLQRDTLAKGRTTVLLARSHPEVFGDLRLAEPRRQSSRPWLAARAALLAATRRLPATRRAVFALCRGARAARLLALAALLPGGPRLRLLGRGGRGAARIRRRGRAVNARG